MAVSRIKKLQKAVAFHDQSHSVSPSHRSHNISGFLKPYMSVHRSVLTRSEIYGMLSVC